MKNSPSVLLFMCLPAGMKLLLGMVKVGMTPALVSHPVLKAALSSSSSWASDSKATLLAFCVHFFLHSKRGPTYTPGILFPFPQLCFLHI